MNRRGVAGLAALLVLAASPGGAEAPPLAHPVIDLYTMGPGDELFSTFGHAALCVGEDTPDAALPPPSRCYNYGTADFRTPLPLTWDFVRGRARFWVSVVDEAAMLAAYVRADRTVYRQRVVLPPPAAAQLARDLALGTDEAHRYYLYHHFRDNCTTRLRDLLDAASGGALRRPTTPRRESFRDEARAGFAGDAALLAMTDLLLGHPADGGRDSWSAMFLPRELRAEVATRLAAPPQLVYQRRARLPNQGSTVSGSAVFPVVGALLALLLGLARSRRARRAALALAGLVLGLLAALLLALALLSTFPELRENELLLALWPSDLLLPLLPPRFRRGYAGLRLLLLALVLALHLGLFTQPLSPLALPALPLLVIFVRASRV